MGICYHRFIFVSIGERTRISIWTNQQRAAGWKIRVTQNSNSNSLHFLQQATISSLWANENVQDKPDKSIPFPMILAQSDDELLLKFAANKNGPFWNFGPWTWVLSSHIILYLLEIVRRSIGYRQRPMGTQTWRCSVLQKNAASSNLEFCVTRVFHPATRCWLVQSRRK